jgi:hypothetical protein
MGTVHGWHPCGSKQISDRDDMAQFSAKFALYKALLPRMSQSTLTAPVCLAGLVIKPAPVNAHLALRVPRLTKVLPYLHSHVFQPSLDPSLKLSSDALALYHPDGVLVHRLQPLVAALIGLIYLIVVLFHLVFF